MKNSAILCLWCLYSGFIYAVTVSAADLSFPDHNSGMLFGYTPGPIISTDSPTDLAINGIGFFILRPPGSTEPFYSKTGSFRFDGDGNLISVNGFIVNGWKASVNPDTGQVGTVGAVTDIQIPDIDPSNISIDANGILFEKYAPDNIVPRFQIALSQFYDPHRLEEVQDNLFRATLDSGMAITNYPGAFGLGTVENYALEEMDPDFSYEADIRVNGDQYLIVRNPKISGQVCYLTSGAFRLNQNGQMVSSEDFVVQGWRLIHNDTTGEAERDGDVSDIEFPSFTSPPEPSDRIKTIVNIDADSINHSPGTNALSLAWNGRLDRDHFIPSTAYEHQVSTSVYDALGCAHDVCIYFDHADAVRTVEFIVTCIPGEDMRFTSSPLTDAGYGLLGRGLIRFTDQGAIAEMTFEKLVLSDPVNSGAWELQYISTDSAHQHFTLTANFIGLTETAMDIGLDFGAGWDGFTWIPEEFSTTYTSQASATVSASANGYGTQALVRLLIDEAGIITGYYSKGRMLPRFQVTLDPFEDNNAFQGQPFRRKARKQFSKHFSTPKKRLNFESERN